jgi:uncharacterized protein
VPLSLPELIVLALVGLVAGALGGLLGIGGSLLIIPALAIVRGPNQHLYQAAAMIVNVFVALPSAVQHARAGAVRWRLCGRMLPFAIAAIVLGVVASNFIDGYRLQQIFGVFLLYVIGFNIVRIARPRPEPLRHEYRTGWPFAGTVGSIMGFLAGLLGIGGGAIVVPLLQRIANLPLRQSIGTSSAAMCITAIIGAAMKNATLSQHVDMQHETARMLTYADSLWLAALLIPTAFIGGGLGAKMTHILPLVWVRLAFVLIMLWAAARMLHIL